MANSTYTDVTLYRRLILLARPHWLHIAGLFLLSLLATPLALLNPVPLKIAVDSVIGSEPIPSFLDAVLPAAATQSPTAVLALAVGLLLAITLLSRLTNLGQSLLRRYTAEKLTLNFRTLLFRHAQRLSLSYHDSKGSSDSVYRIRRDASAIEHIAIGGVIPFITAAIQLAAMLYVTFKLAPQLALLTLAFSPVVLLVARARRRRLRTVSRKVKDIESKTLSVLQEVLGAIRVVTAFGQEDREVARFVQRSRQGLRERIRLAMAEGGYSVLSSLATAGATGVVLFVGMRHVQGSVLSLGELLVIMNYLGRLRQPIRSIGQKSGSLQTHLASAERGRCPLPPSPPGTWNHFLPPTIVEWWPSSNELSSSRFTTVASWSSYSDLEYRGEWYRSKYEEFQRFADLPNQVDQDFEVVLKSFRRDDQGIRLLREKGWFVSNASQIGNLSAYQRYISRSRAEIGIAKNAYVKGRSGLRTALTN